MSDEINKIDKAIKSLAKSARINGFEVTKIRECKGAKEIIDDLQKWADEGVIKSLAVGVVFTDGRSFTDWCADYPINIEHQIGNIEVLKGRLINRANKVDDD